MAARNKVHLTPNKETVPKSKHSQIWTGSKVPPNPNMETRSKVRSHPNMELSKVVKFVYCYYLCFFAPQKCDPEKGQKLNTKAGWSFHFFKKSCIGQSPRDALYGNFLLRPARPLMIWENLRSPLFQQQRAYYCHILCFDIFIYIMLWKVNGLSETSSFWWKSLDLESNC